MWASGGKGYVPHRDLSLAEGPVGVRLVAFVTLVLLTAPVVFLPRPAAASTGGGGTGNGGGSNNGTGPSNGTGPITTPIAVPPWVSGVILYGGIAAVGIAGAVIVTLLVRRHRRPKKPPAEEPSPKW